MKLLARVRYGDVHWGPLLIALVLTACGVAFVYSACIDPASSSGWSRESTMQVMWWCLSLFACFVCAHVPPGTWRMLAIPSLIVAIFVQLFLIAAAGTPLAPRINGQANWLVLGPLRIQPSEFTKIATILTLAAIAGTHGTDVRRFTWSAMLLIIGLCPAVLLAKEDLGSAITFLPMLLGLLIFAGASLTLIASLVVCGLGTIFIGVMQLDRDGYMWKRIQAWLDPESYALSQGFQSLRALRSIGSGQFSGKGYGVGDQNLLGWVPEKHTDMIFAVIGEETGFVGSSMVVIGFLAFGLIGLWAAMSCRDRFGRFFIGAFTCLVMGQAAVNLAVVLGLMPVTGVTLPFFSYGGSSLLGLYIGLGICLACTTAKQHGFTVRK